MQQIEEFETCLDKGPLHRTSLSNGDSCGAHATLGCGSHSCEEGETGKGSQRNREGLPRATRLIRDPSPKPKLDAFIKQNVAAVQAIVGQHNTSIEQPG